jgi:hypothetical protein
MLYGGMRLWHELAASARQIAENGREVLVDAGHDA